MDLSMKQQFLYPSPNRTLKDSCCIVHWKHLLARKHLRRQWATHARSRNSIEENCFYVIFFSQNVMLWILIVSAETCGKNGIFLSLQGSSASQSHVMPTRPPGATSNFRTATKAQWEGASDRKPEEWLPALISLILHSEKVPQRGYVWFIFVLFFFQI